MKQKDKKERDKIIRKLHKEGMKVFYLSHYFGLTRQQIYNIIHPVDNFRKKGI